MGYSSDVLAYSAATCDFIFDVASTTTLYCVYLQTTYDMANDSTIFLLSSSPWIPYGPTSVFDKSTSHARNRADFSGTFIWTTLSITSCVAFYDLNPNDNSRYTSTTVIHFTCNGPPCSASSTPCPFYNSNIGLRFDYLPLRHTHLCDSHWTNIFVNMANCSRSSS